MNIFSGGSYIEKLLRDGGDLDSMDRSLFDCDVSKKNYKTCYHYLNIQQKEKYNKISFL